MNQLSAKLALLSLLVLFVLFTTAACQSNPVRGSKTNGALCAQSSECQSGYCADGRRCAPMDFTGLANEYCHHDNHCRSGRCGCDNGLRGPDSFCNNWRSGGSGTCTDRRDNGNDCTKNENCNSGHCADKGKVGQLDFWTGSGGRCAPNDGTGAAGAYCHHNNHCASGSCNCPGGTSFGFCASWEGFGMNVADTIGGRPNPQSIKFQMSRGFFRCN
ncbi:MAG: hypothetical protein AAF604_10755 [Acidobacteriota bacterium]